MSVRKAWAFTLDGHVFYVLGVFAQGTLLFDVKTGQWCIWKTSGKAFWNMHRGAMWRSTILAADETLPIVWELSPEVDTDEGSLLVERVVTGFQPVRGSGSARQGAMRVTADSGHSDIAHLSLVEVSEGVYEFQETGPEDAVIQESAEGSDVFDVVEAFSATSELKAVALLNGTIGEFTDAPAGTLRMRFSDDGGVTWSKYRDIALQPGNYGQLLQFRSLGRLRSPGRIWEISDAGGLVRIDGADSDMDGGQ